MQARDLRGSLLSVLHGPPQARLGGGSGVLGSTRQLLRAGSSVGGAAAGTAAVPVNSMDEGEVLRQRGDELRLVGCLLCCLC